MKSVLPLRKSTAVPAPVIKLSYPLTVKALRQAFEALGPASIELNKQPKYQEATVDGAWSLTRLTLHFRNLGFKPTGPQNMLAFVNSDETIGLVLYGVEPHPTRNAWKNYSIEVQARPRSVAQNLPELYAASAPGLLQL